LLAQKKFQIGICWPGWILVACSPSLVLNGSSAESLHGLVKAAREDPVTLHVRRHGAHIRSWMRLQPVDNLQTHRRGPLPRPNNSYHGFLMPARRHAGSAFAVCVAQTAANRKVCMLHLSGGDAEHKSRAALRGGNDRRAAVPNGNVLVELRRRLPYRILAFETPYRILAFEKSARRRVHYVRIV